MGLSARPDGGYDKKTQGHDIGGVLDALKIDRADLVTHDIGNMVGFALAKEYPGRVTRFDAEQLKAWSQNLGHENCLTTFSSYGEISPARQDEIIRGLANAIHAPDAQLSPELLRRIADQMERTGSSL